MIFLREYSEELPTSPLRTDIAPENTWQSIERETRREEPHWYTGVVDSLWQGAYSAYLENKSSLLGVVSSTGLGDEDFKSWLDETAKESRQLVRDEYMPNPEKTGMAAQVMYGEIGRAHV